MTSSTRTRVAIVEDHALTRAGLRTALEAAYDVVAEAADGLAGLDAIRRERPDVAVIDIGLPGMDGVTLTKRVRAELPQTHVVIVTMIDLEDEVLAALGAGADAYCLKSSEPERIVDAVRIAAEGGAYFDPSIAHVVLARFSSYSAERRALVAANAARNGDRSFDFRRARQCRDCRALTHWSRHRQRTYSRYLGEAVGFGPHAGRGRRLAQGLHLGG